MVGELVVMCDTLKIHLEDLKIKEGHLDLPNEVVGLKVHDLKEGFEWLRKIYTTEYTTLIQVKRLLTPLQWKQYELFGMEDFEDHQEVVLLRKAQRMLRKALVSQDRPNLFKKGYVNEQLSEEAHG